MDDGVDLCDYPFQQSAIDIQGTGADVVLHTNHHQVSFLITSIVS